MHLIITKIVTSKEMRFTIDRDA